ncbi:MAG: ABC transporter ATP-binding protein [Myxococcota bacterium]|jgi:ABC-2 type transport system ATP-binding protein|nr:ABC transporter ATP-binding protein [Myxococcota bacterium]
MSESSAQAKSEAVISIRKLSKTFSLGFRRKRVEAVSDCSFDVYRGEIFGLVGPNGAGKTTTIKCLMGLIAPTAGEIKVFGQPVPSRESRRRIGYLPEISYYYDYLKPEEILDFYGRLYGLGSAERKRQVDWLLERVGLADARAKPLRKFSKGMLQRIGLAQALIANPDIVILDEPQSGLDPLGRKEVADIIHELKQQGKTIFFSSHILPDVERVCDRVAVMINGALVDIGPLASLLNPRTLVNEIATSHVDVELVEQWQLRFSGLKVLKHSEGNTFLLPGECSLQSFLVTLVEAKVSIDSVSPRRESLEDVFVRQALAGQEAKQRDSKANAVPL